MDVLMLSRLQFAVATLFHFIFVPLTLGLSVLIAVMETRYLQTGDEDYKRMAKFWGKLFLINFALGVVTGITLEFQFGTNWSRYSAYVGDIFGSLLAIEASVAFFLESTFVAVWVFGWDKVKPKTHLLAIWLVAIASNLSALWIIIANAWMQHPVGYVLRNGRAELDDFFAVITSSWAWAEFGHVILGSWALGAFFVLGVSCYHFLRKNETAFFQKSFNIAVVFALVCSIGLALVGHVQGNHVAQHQPAKLAAMESHWETQRNAPMYLLAAPNLSGEGNMIEALPIPGLLSFLAFNDFNAEVKGLNDFPKEDRPPVALTFLSFRAMVGIGTIMPILAFLAFIWRFKLQEKRWFMRVLLFAIPLPYLALEFGWMVAEVGRQPWIVQGMMRTKDAVSPLVTQQVAISLVAFIVVYAVLGAVDIYLLKKYAQKGPVH